MLNYQAWIAGLACFSFPQNCLSNSSKIEFATKHVWNSVDTRCEKQLPQGPIATRNDATTPNEQNLFSIGPFKAEPIKTYNLLSHSTLLHSTCAFLRNTYFLSTYIQILYIYKSIICLMSVPVTLCPPGPI